MLFERVVDESGWGLSEREHVERSVEEELEAAGQRTPPFGDLRNLHPFSEELPLVLSVTSHVFPVNVCLAMKVPYCSDTL